jgi:hypothetical protein
MQSFSADPANFHCTMSIRPALVSFVDEVYGTLARICAYLMTLALLAIGGVALWDALPEAIATAPSVKDGWSLAERPARAFAISQVNLHDKTEVYEIFRHPEGGRKDVFHWSGTDQKPVAGLEIYRPGGELHQAGPARAELAAGMDPDGARKLETAGMIDSKFGTVALLRPIGRTDATGSCLGFIKQEDPALRISGWSCQGGNLPARRATVGCMLNRLILLTAGNDAKLAELFARAELRRSECATSALPAPSADWLTGADNPRLRGGL